MRRIVVAGASKGLGAAVAQHFAAAGDEVISLSRSRSDHGTWLPCDLADPNQIAGLSTRITPPVDALIIVAGIWEAAAFSPDYRFGASPVDEISRILAVNLQAPILLARALLPQLRGGRILLIGSTSGLDQIGTPEVAYNASKAGLRGAAQALAQALRAQQTAVAILNPGDIASEEMLAAKASGQMRDEGSLAVQDVLDAIGLLANLSPSASFCEVNMVALHG